MKVTFNGREYSDDGSASRDFRNGGAQRWMFSLLSDMSVEVKTAMNAQVYAVQAAASLVAAQSVVAGYSATSASSLSVVVGTISLTVTTGRQFQPGAMVQVYRTGDTSKSMWGQVSSYNIATGAMVVVTSVALGTGSGPYTDWTVIMSGARGPSGVPSGMVRRAIVGADAILASDAGKLLDCSGTFPLTFSAPVTLGADSWYTIRNSGPGIVTLSSPVNIDGVPTYAVMKGHTVTVHCDGATLRVLYDDGPKIFRYPIFDPLSATMEPASASETLEDSAVNVGLGTNVSIGQIVCGSGLFVASSAAYPSNKIATSPSSDGLTWTIRTMPSSGVWYLGAGPTGFVANIPNTTTIASSAAGTSWVPATALPDVSQGASSPQFVGAICLIPSGTAGLAYTSNNYGATWATVTLPAPLPSAGRIVVVNGLFWYWSGTNVAYTSPTGATGSWLARALPISLISIGEIHCDVSGSIIIFNQSGTGPYYRSTNGIAWDLMVFPPPNAITNFNDYCIQCINGIWCHMINLPAEQCCTWNNGKWARRSTRVSAMSNGGSAVNPSGTIYIMCNINTIGTVGRITIGTPTSATAIFGG